MQDLRLSGGDFEELLTGKNDYNMRINLEQIKDGTDSEAHATPTSTASNSPKGSPEAANGVVPQRCGYRTGKCQNLQAVKRNGKLHKLCEFHREKANQNQKKLDRKKRMLRYSPYEMQLPSDEEPVKVEEDSPRSMEDFDVYAPIPTSLEEAPLALGCEELLIFYNLMTFDINQHMAPSSASSMMQSQTSMYTYASTV
ncbi:hypothetical protein Poli38472_006806 [Pythium oligandrum]|uniref:Uncharacterized protein n=1 Tax=Pythium oligandrum TaxID=41045 RepID=A0A8K1C587_PYTOL|nr:hypothetical protein Poli38472_006806 [Pythium oligandrum]|eukprot:TMW56796.1 hypothetical protein Poli38472_006806 [Pythium oligandrum]